MKRGHYAILRFIERFDRSSEEETERVGRLNLDLATALMDLDYVPYKCPGVFYEEVARRLDPGFLELMRRVKRTLDPDGILNPDRWALP
jgi:FAD/FMN-containing dehydrogenase